MKDLDKLSNFREALLAQDSPSPARALAHQEILLTKIHRRMRIEKLLVAAVYMAVFGLGFFCFWEAGQVQESGHAVWWAVCSMHLLLWFLVFFLWRVERLMGRIWPSSNRARPTREENRAVFIAALVVCALGTGFLVQAALVQNPLRIAEAARYILWCPLFFLFWYPFGIGTAAARLWIKFREMEPQTPSLETAGGSPPTGDAAAGNSTSQPQPPSL